MGIDRVLPLSAILVVLAGTASAADVDPYLPNDAEAVLTVNVRQILDAPLIKKHALESVQKLLESGGLKDLQDLDLDLQKDIDRVVLANSGSEADRLLLIAHGRFEVAKFEAKAAELAKAQPKLWKITTVPDGAGGQYKVLESSRWFDLSGRRPGVKEKPSYVALLDKRVLVVSPAKDLVIDALDKSRGRKQTALKNKELNGLLEKADHKQSVWIAALPRVFAKALPGDDDSSIKDELEKVDAITGGITIDEDLKLEIGLAVKDADTARELTTEINDGINIMLTLVAVMAREKKELEPALDALKTIKATAKDNAIILKGAISAEMIDKALKKAKP
jgi:hypothetical protein